MFQHISTSMKYKYIKKLGVTGKIGRQLSIKERIYSQTKKVQ